MLASDQPNHSVPPSDVIFASPGRIEGRTETVQVGAAADGVVKAVFVKEGQRVSRGTRLAEIGCDDLVANLGSARAEAESARQAKLRIVRGSRDEERLSAEQKTRAAKAVLEEATSRLNRMKKLSESGVIAATEMDQSQRDYDVAVAQLKEATRNEELVKAQALTEDIDKSDADIRAAEYRVMQVEEKMSKCDVVSPMDGTVLRVQIKPGEAYSTMAPKSLFNIADLSVRRVRAEVDERDVAKVHPGQPVMVSLDAAQDDKYSGVVESTSRTMGRKKVDSGDPSDKADRDVMETMILLKKDRSCRWVSE